MKTGKIRKAGKNRKPRERMGNQGKGQGTKENAGRENQRLALPPNFTPGPSALHTALTQMGRQLGASRKLEHLFLGVWRPRQMAVLPAHSSPSTRF